MVEVPAAQTQQGYDAFLSYNSKDELDVKTIFEYLTDAGLKLWVDFECVKPGDVWLDSMQDGLKNSKACVVFFRNEPGVWHKEETHAAIRKKSANPFFKIIPVLLPGGSDTDLSMPDILQGTSYVDLRERLFDLKEWKRLAEAIRGREVVAIHEGRRIRRPTTSCPRGIRRT